MKVKVKNEISVIDKAIKLIPDGYFKFVVGHDYQNEALSRLFWRENIVSPIHSNLKEDHEKLNFYNSVNEVYMAEIEVIAKIIMDENNIEGYENVDLEKENIIDHPLDIVNCYDLAYYLWNKYSVPFREVNGEIILIKGGTSFTDFPAFCKYDSLSAFYRFSELVKEYEKSFITSRCLLSKWKEISVILIIILGIFFYLLYLK